MKRLIIALFFVNCIVSGNMMICNDTETGQSWTIFIN
jgi:hypothetical protein